MKQVPKFHVHSYLREEASILYTFIISYIYIYLFSEPQALSRENESRLHRDKYTVLLCLSLRLLEFQHVMKSCRRQNDLRNCSDKLRGPSTFGIRCNSLLKIITNSCSHIYTDLICNPQAKHRMTPNPSASAVFFFPNIDFVLKH